jgi:hypothetical protein
MSIDALGPFLAEAERLLRDKALAGAAGEARFAGLMVASALGMASREISLRERIEAAERAMSADAAAIRAGRHDGDAALYQQLMALAALRTAVTRPQVLRPEEKSSVGLD